MFALFVHLTVPGVLATSFAVRLLGPWAALVKSWFFCTFGRNASGFLDLMFLRYFMISDSRSEVLWQLAHEHFSLQNLPCVKHSQYIFRQRDLLHLHARFLTVSVFSFSTVRAGSELILTCFSIVFLPRPLVRLEHRLRLMTDGELISFGWLLSSIILTFLLAFSSRFRQFGVVYCPGRLIQKLSNFIILTQSFWEKFFPAESRGSSAYCAALS